MMSPLPDASSFWRSTLLSGAFSVRGTLGMESPALTMVAIEVYELEMRIVRRVD